MAEKVLYLKSIKFPDYGSDNSKKNFALVYLLTYNIKKDDGTSEKVTFVSKQPDDDRYWQWKKTGNFYLKPLPKADDMIELDLSRLRTNDYGFQSDDYIVSESDGDLIDIDLFIFDVKDSNFGDKFKHILERIGESGIEASVQLAGFPAPVASLIKAGTAFLGDNKSVTAKFEKAGKVAEVTGKVLFKGSWRKANGVPILMKGEKIWDGNKVGKYAVELDFE